MLNISKTLRDITIESMEVEYETDHVLSLGTMTLTLDDRELY